jgi:SOS response regulatory protein OraA/RecX
MSETSLILRYISKYAPSLARLNEYAIKKWCIDILSTIEEIGFDEVMFCELWIRSYISMWRSRRDIETRLLRKQFSKESIQKWIESYKESLCNWEEYESKILLLIQKHQRKGKSIRFIEVELVSQYPYFRDEIRETLSGMANQENLLVHKEKILSKYNLSLPIEKRKALDFLIRKGFSYKDSIHFLQTIYTHS